MGDMTDDSTHDAGPRGAAGHEGPARSGVPAVELVRDVVDLSELARAPELDPTQAAVMTSDAATRLVLGGPGTGKSTVAVEALVHAVQQGIAPDSCVVLSATRLRAAAVRDRIAARTGSTSSAPLARTPQALGFGILRRWAALEGRAAPRLLTGPEQDVILRELLAGHARGDAPGPRWPDFVREALPTKGFRHELRDLLMRAVEWGLDSEQLRDLGELHERPAWIAAADMLQEYDAVTALSRPGAYDPAWIISGAVDLLENDPEQLAALHDELRLIVVDDAHELTRAAARLVGLLTGPRTRLVLLGDPDLSVQTFRGADPSLFLEVAERSGEPVRFVLGTNHRLPARLASAAATVAARIGTVAGVGHRITDDGTGRAGRVGTAVLRAVSQESAHIAAELRRMHFEESVPWSQMAVITRGQSRITALRRVLQSAGVPIAVPPTVTSLRDEPAVRPLLALLAVVEEMAHDRPPRWGVDDLVDVLGSPLVRADSLTLRRIRRALRTEELASGGDRTSDDLLLAAVLRPELAHAESVAPLAAPLARVHRMLRAGVGAWKAPAATAETVLWAMWEAASVASEWSRIALAGGAAGARADHDLDAVVALFSSAASYVDRLPGGSPAGFLEHIQEQEVPGDRLTSSAPVDDAVALLTTQAAAGQEWQFVVVAGVQEGVWPDLRLRGSLLGSEALADTLRGRPDDLRAQAAAVRYDETRQFLVAITRATDRLLVTAVRSDEEQPSVYLDLIDPIEGERPFTEVAQQLDLRASVARLRQELVATEEEGLAPERAAVMLAELAAADVPGADPHSWWAFHDLSSEHPIRPSGQPVTISPSRVDDFTTCQLRWFLTTRGAQGPDVGAATLGTLVHDIAADLADSEPERMAAALEERWPLLGLPDSWIAAQQKALARRMITRLQQYLVAAKADGWTPAGVEVDFDVTDGRVRLRGRVDRLERHEEHGVRVIDLKTGSSAKTRAELLEHPQLGAYQWAVEHGAFEEVGDVSGGAALVQVGKAAKKDDAVVQTQQALADHPDPHFADDLLRRSAEGMSGARFSATPNPQCTTCPVRRACPARAEGDS